MKTAKKILSTLLVAVMILALSVTAFADTGKITVADAGDSNYRAYKIFDAEVDDTDPDEPKVVYTIAADSPWLEVVRNDDGTSNIAGLTFGDTAPYTVTWGPGFSAADFAETLKTNIPDTATPIAFTDGSTAANLDKGYYLVISSDAAETDFDPQQAKAALTTVLDNTVTIQNKNDMPFDKTVDDEKVEGVQVGDVLDFKLEGKVPTDVDDDDTFYAYYISDKMDAGLDFDKDSFTVKIDGTEIDLDEIALAEAPLIGDQVRFGQNGKTFELSLEMLTRGKDDSLKGKTIEITYQATVNENAVARVTENNAVLEYGNDPSNLTIKDSQTKVYTSQIIIDKFENGAPEQKLQGAKFVLKNGSGKYYKYTPASPAVPGSGDPGDPDYVAPQAAVDAEVEWVDDIDDATEVETDTNGAAQFAGLEDGTYELIETAAPVGYVKLESPIEIVVNGSDSITPGLDAGQVAMILTQVANVANTPGTNLPSTGGIGTTIFYMVGTVLILGAAVVLILRKRTNNEV